MLSRPSDNGHTPFGDIYISYSPDMKYWGEHRCVMKVTPFPESAWQCTKIGAGSVPFLTDEGWLLFYHGVITTCNGFRYAMGSAILDKDHPEKVLYRTREYLLGPAAPYELQGDVPNVLWCGRYCGRYGLRIYKRDYRFYETNEYHLIKI